ncbi:MAG: hypothetical protein LBL08_03650 [Candidatus Nomurabacteria bacterium]|jgi:hypothetical protein|nr:hypothetical protein [Candidatus Nomurabacteria bacterium]
MENDNERLTLDSMQQDETATAAPPPEPTEEDYQPNRPMYEQAPIVNDYDDAVKDSEPAENEAAPEEDEEDEPAAPIGIVDEVLAQSDAPEQPEEPEIKEEPVLPAKSSGFKTDNGGKKHFLVSLAAVVVVGGLAACSIYFASESQRLRTENENMRQDEIAKQQSQNSDEATDEVINMIGKLIDLPLNEKPKVYSISDRDAKDAKTMAKNLLGGTQLFKDNDKVLLYSGNKLFVVYRPDEHRIVRSGQLAE